MVTLTVKQKLNQAATDLIDEALEKMNQGPDMITPSQTLKTGKKDEGGK